MQCYLCNETEFSHRKGSVRDNPELDILECESCGLVTLSSLQHIKDNHYEESGMHGDDLPSVKSWAQGAERDDERRFNLLKDTIVNAKIMDFGCGASGFISKAESLARKVVGVEPEQRVHEYWKDRLEIYISLKEVDDDFDLITAFHVVEHLPDPIAILKSLAKCIKKGGRIVIEVPNSNDALLTLYDSNSFQNFTYWSQHLFLFNANNLQKLANQAGLRTVSIQQYQRYPLSNHLYWLSKNRGGGHIHWPFLDNPDLDNAYSASLASIGKCDTLIAYLEI